MHETKKQNYGRRQFLKVASTAAGGMLLVACGNEAQTSVPLKEIPVASVLPSEQITATTTASTGKTFFPAPDPRVPHALTAPLPLTQSVRFIPGTGNKITSFAITYKQPVKPKSQNQYWQELDRRLNVKLEAIQAAGPEVYREKAAALMASDELPDLFQLLFWASPALYTPVQQGAFLDLNEYLTGDALKEYPNLAKIPQMSWDDARVNGKIYGIPRPQAPTGSTLIFRYDWAREVGMEQPKNADDFFRLMREFTKADRWGIGLLGGETGAANQFFYEMFRVPNRWRLEKNGKLTYYLQTPEFKASIEYIKKLYDAGIFHPDALVQPLQDAKRGLSAGKFGAYQDGILALPREIIDARKLKPDADIGVLLPFGHDGGKAVHWMGGASAGITALPSKHQGNPERVKEILRVMDYLASPPFTVESSFLGSGLENQHHKMNPDGKKTLTDLGQQEIGDLLYFAAPFPMMYYPDLTEVGPKLQQYMHGLITIGLPNPVHNKYSPTQVRQQPKWDQLFKDRFLRIIKGTDPLSSIDEFYKDWQKNDGDTVRKEFEEQIQKNK